MFSENVFCLMFLCNWPSRPPYWWFKHVHLKKVKKKKPQCKCSVTVVVLLKLHLPWGHWCSSSCCSRLPVSVWLSDVLADQWGALVPMVGGASVPVHRKCHDSAAWQTPLRWENSVSFSNHFISLRRDEKKKHENTESEPEGRREIWEFTQTLGLNSEKTLKRRNSGCYSKKRRRRKVWVFSFLGKIILRIRLNSCSQTNTQIEIVTIESELQMCEHRNSCSSTEILLITIKKT